MKENILWDLNTNRSELRNFFHENTVSSRSFTSVQIKPVTSLKKWDKKDSIQLKEFEAVTPLEKLLKTRRTHRKVTGRDISLSDISKILSFSVGISDKERGYFTYPSPGALYPCTLFLTIKSEDFEQLIYRYNPYTHSLEIYNRIEHKFLDEVVLDKDLQRFPLKIFFATDYQLIEEKYGELSYRLLNQEVGHMAQNLSLYIGSVGLHSVCIGGYSEMIFKKYVDSSYDLMSVMVVG